MLTATWALVGSQTAARRSELLADAENLAKTLRAKVLKRMVLKDVGRARARLTVEVEDANGRLSVRTPGGPAVETWPTWGRPDLRLVTNRVRALATRGGIVVTPFPDTARPRPVAGVRVVSLRELPSVLDDLVRPPEDPDQPAQERREAAPDDSGTASHQDFPRSG